MTLFKKKTKEKTKKELKVEMKELQKKKKVLSLSKAKARTTKAHDRIKKKIDDLIDEIFALSEKIEKAKNNNLRF